MILNTTKPAKLGSKNGNAVFQLANREFFIFYKPSDKNTGTGSRLPPSNYLLGQIDFLFALSLHILQRLLRGDSAGGRSAQKFNLDLAIKAALKLKGTDSNRYSKLSLSDEEVLAWHSLRDNLKECRDPQTGRYLPDETFTRLEPVDIKSLKTDDGASYHHVCFDRLQRYQVIKQADTLLLMSRLPKKFTPEERLNAWEDFEPCCLHDSTLSFASHALFAAQNGLQEAAEKYFKKALYLDLHEIMNNTGKEGLHLACLGETWSSIFFGFLGATFDGDTPVFSPVLPSGWKALRMNFYWRGEFYRLMVFEGRYSISRI